MAKEDHRFGRVEIANVSIPEAIKKHRVSPCAYSYMVPIILIPGIESPFNHLGLNHDEDERC